MTEPSDVGKPGVGGLRRVLAVLVSLAVPGAGHFLLGAFRRGLAWAVGLALLGVLMLFAVPISVVIVSSLVAAVIGRVAAAIDAAVIVRPRPAWKFVLAAWAALLVGRLTVDAALTKPLAAYYTTNYAQPFVIPTGGMEPTLLIGDSIMVDRSAYRVHAPERNDIVVFAYPPDVTRDFIKRIIGVPGDVVVVRDQQVLVNGQVLIEPYVGPQRFLPAPASRQCRYSYGCEPMSVPADSYFVLGDSRDNSQDSRYWGFVERQHIKGKASVIYWSWDVNRNRLRTDRLGRPL